MRLLVIEGERRTAAQLQRGLAESGFVVDIVGTADDGLSLVRTRAYDAILLDLGLPARTAGVCSSGSVPPATGRLCCASRPAMRSTTA